MPAAWESAPMVGAGDAPAWAAAPMVSAKQEPLTADPTGSTGQNIAAGAGKAIADAGRGAVLRSGQALSNAPASLPGLQILNLAMEKMGMSPKAAVEDSKAGIRESRKLDAPLMATGGGMSGNVGGTALMLAPTAGASTPLAAGVVGGLTGLAQPALDAKESLFNTVLGAFGGAGGQYIGNKGAALMRGRVDKAATAQAANTPRMDAARTASKEGYVIPPADLEPGILSEAVSGLGGKIKTAQTASQRNQPVTDALAKKAIGAAADQPLTADALQAIRQKAATEGYAPIRKAGTVQADQKFFKALDDIASTHQGAARSFPGLADNGVANLVANLKREAFDAGDAIDATKVLREAADKAYRQGDNTLGKASKAAADAIEDMLDRHLSAAGNSEAVAAFRDARKLIAKTYSVQKGLNSETGNVSAQALAKQLEKGKPLSDELLTIGKTASAFPKATQSLKEAPKAYSPLDFAVGGIGAGAGNPLPALMMAARPAARNAMLSKLVQEQALKKGAPAPISNAVQKALENRMTQLLLGPIGTAGAVHIGQK